MRRYLNTILHFSNRDSSKLFKLTSGLGGLFIFLVIIPRVLIPMGVIINDRLGVTCPRELELLVGGLFVPFGLFIIVWSVRTMWKVGGGTQAPIAPPQRLIVTGPFKLCRNPIQLAIMSYYLGLGAIFGGLTAGVVCLIIMLVLGGSYHRFLEERELAVRFGKEYEEYRKSTPFLIPRLRGNKHE